jgi:hypothetical protein
LIFIDWKSPSNHHHFNTSLLQVLKSKIEKYYIFNEHLIIKDIDYNLVNGHENRIIRFFSVIKICIDNYEKKIFFLTYDSILIVFLQLFFKSIRVYEHNTTPEHTYDKHYFYQKIFYRNIIRFAQYKSQVPILKTINDKQYFVGSPIAKMRMPERTKEKNLIVIPGTRIDPSAILKILPFLEEYDILIKNHSRTDEVNKIYEESINVKITDYIDLTDFINRALAVVITNRSGVRGSGWYSEAISRGIPIIITGMLARSLFIQTYKGYPFLSSEDLFDKKNMMNKLEKVKNFNNCNYIKTHNSRILKRVEAFEKKQDL